MLTENVGHEIIILAQFRCVYAFFSPLKWIQQDPMEVFTHDVKKIEGTANKNGLKNAMCKQSLTESPEIF